MAPDLSDSQFQVLYLLQAEPVRMFLTLLSLIHLQGLCRVFLSFSFGYHWELKGEGVCSCRVQFASFLLLSLHSDRASAPALLCSLQFPCVSLEVPTDRVMAQAFVFVPYQYLLPAQPLTS